MVGVEGVRPWCKTSHARTSRYNKEQGKDEIGYRLGGSNKAGGEAHPSHVSCTGTYQLVTINVTLLPLRVVTLATLHPPSSSDSV